MKGVLIVLTVMALSAGTMESICAAQQDAAPQTVKGDLLTIKGDVYVIKDQFGRLVRLRINEETKKERLVVPGERIEVEMWPDGRAVSIKSAPQ
ncbi:MAG: hypothetical protein ACREI2_04475 [Nitrospiraceae bacterium]